MKNVFVVVFFLSCLTSLGQIPNKVVGDSIFSYPDQFFYTDHYEDSVQKVIDTYQLHLQWDSLSNYYYFNLLLDEVIYQMAYKENYSEAIKRVGLVLGESDDPNVLARAVQQLCMVYNYLDLHQKAVEVMESNQHIYFDSGIEALYFDYHLSLGAFYSSLARAERHNEAHLEKAVEHYTEALQWKGHARDRDVQNLLSLYHSLLLDFDRLKDPSVLYRNEYQFPNTQVSQHTLFDVNMNLAQYYLDTDQLDSALKYINILDSLASADPPVLNSRRQSRTIHAKGLYLIKTGDPDGVAVLKSWLNTRDSLIYKQKARLHAKLLANAEGNLELNETGQKSFWNSNLFIHIIIDIIAVLLALVAYYFLRFKKSQSVNGKAIENQSGSHIILAEHPEQAEIKYMDVLRKLDEKFSDLTKNDRRTWVYLYEGFTNKETAKLRGVSVRAVESAIYRLYKKTGLSSTQELREEFRNNKG